MSVKLFEEMQKLTNELKGLVDGQDGQFKDFSGETKGSIDAINTRISEIEVAMNRKSVGVETGAAQMTEEEIQEKKNFQTFLTTGEVKAMATDSDPDGGYLVPKAFNNRVIARLRDMSPIRQIAGSQVITLGSSFPFPIETVDDMGSGWVGERESRPNTATGKIDIIDIPLHEMYGQPPVTRRMIEDSGIDIESWLVNKLGDRFSRLEGAAFVNGDGHKKPIGLLVSERVAEYEGTLGSTTQFDDLIMMMANIRQGLQANAGWLMNRFSLAFLRTLKDQEGSYLWQPSVQPGVPATILGKGYTIADDMPNAIDGTGTLITGNTPIMYGDFREGYMVVDKGSITMLRDEFTQKPFILFYSTKRTGGDVVNDQALTKLKLV